MIKVATCSEAGHPPDEPTAVRKGGRSKMGKAKIAASYISPPINLPGRPVRRREMAGAYL